MSSYSQTRATRSLEEEHPSTLPITPGSDPSFSPQSPPPAPESPRPSEPPLKSEKSDEEKADRLNQDQDRKVKSESDEEKADRLNEEDNEEEDRKGKSQKKKKKKNKEEKVRRLLSELSRGRRISISSDSEVEDECDCPSFEAPKPQAPLKTEKNPEDNLELIYVKVKNPTIIDCEDCPIGSEAPEEEEEEEEDSESEPTVAPLLSDAEWSDDDESIIERARARRRRTAGDGSEARVCLEGEQPQVLWEVRVQEEGHRREAALCPVGRRRQFIGDNACQCDRCEEARKAPSELRLRGGGAQHPRPQGEQQQPREQPENDSHPCTRHTGLADQDPPAGNDECRGSEEESGKS